MDEYLPYIDEKEKFLSIKEKVNEIISYMSNLVDNTYFNYGLIIQGPANPISLSTAYLYLKFFRHVVISCWNTDGKLVEIAKKQYKGNDRVHIIENDETGIITHPQHVFQQMHTTYQGLLELEKQGVIAAVKIRSDMLIGNIRYLRDFLYTREGMGKIFGSSIFFRRTSVVPFHIGDFIIGGKMGDMKMMFGNPRQYRLCAEMTITCNYLLGKGELKNSLYKDKVLFLTNYRNHDEIIQIMKKYFSALDIQNLSPMILRYYGTYVYSYSDDSLVHGDDETWE